MPARKPVPEDVLRGRRRSLHEDVERAGLPLAVAVRRMREALGITQARFAELFRVTERQVWEIENGKGNPTLETLTKLTRPYGFRIGVILDEPPEIRFRRRAPGETHTRAARRTTSTSTSNGS